MGLFSRRRTCDSCGVDLDRGEVNVIDPTFRGEREGRKEELCRNCFKTRITACFREYQGRVAAVHPMPGYNAYQFYALDRMKKYDFDDEWIAGVERILPASGSACEKCGSSASFSWIPPSVYGENEPFEFLVELPPGDRAEILCGRCTASAFCGKVDEHDLTFDEVFPPFPADGLLTSWDA